MVGVETGGPALGEAVAAVDSARAPLGSADAYRGVRGGGFAFLRVAAVPLQFGALTTVSSDIGW